MGLIEKEFAEHLSSLSETEKYAFYFIDAHPYIIRQLTLTQLAERLATSNTTIIRMAKKLDLAGYSEFKYRAMAAVKENTLPDQKDLIGQYRHLFTSLLDNVNFERLRYMATKIHEAKTLYIAGVGLTKPIAEYVAKRFIQLNKPTIYSYESHIIDLIPKLTRPQDVILFLSMSGETQSIIQAVKKFRYVDHNLLFSITNNGDSSLAKMMDANLSSSVPTNHFENYDITSRASLMVQADILIEIYMNMFDQPEN
ncbi:MurR/RpiR family transcriptional regulator [Lacticaseibacillus paracasei]|jgi:DNA-binding MurR/RpiR family transcriptional regulator|uniref:MurR/RpiR family transcriptional regulator n=1 Tax=Lacticaseibacillus paracasei TaxID=1597 RepID=UPI0023599863|nr:MurR/RpiR family transcriptional regulator [Lacticaseibacillus paracasei]WCZ18229.1 MurR/RpiR family transcriptional regulator [Lacticaseibacillus paracasei]